MTHNARTQITLSPDAADKAAKLSALLAELGLSADQAHALLLASDLADQANEDTDSEDDDTAISRALSEWQEEGSGVWEDVLFEIPAFLS